MSGTTSSQWAREIAATLKRHGHLALLVGGCVRDILLGRVASDFDIATDATPNRVLSLFPRAQFIGAKFGVVLVPGENPSDPAAVEVATFRSDHAYRDGRRPESVAYETDPRQDVLRRDFTINALLMDPESGEVIDYVGGRADLDHGIVRAIGDPFERFREDHLRMLRAVRFAARFGFEIDPATFDAIRDLHADIKRIAAERIRDEIARILTEGGARRGFELLDATGLLSDILPEVAAMKGIPQPPDKHPEGDVWTHTLMLLEDLGSPSITLALAALFHDVAKPRTLTIGNRIRFPGHAELGAKMAVEILTRLRFSNEEIARVELLVANHMRFLEAPKMRESALKRFLRLPGFPELLELHHLDRSNGNGDLSTWKFAKSRFEYLPAAELSPPRLLTGSDLIAAGYRPGPEFSKMLDAAEDAQLESRIHTRDEALALIRSEFGMPPQTC